MAYIGQNADGNFTTSVSKDTFSGNGSTTSFTLSEAATTNTVDVFVENIRQEPTTAYTVDGTTLTFTAAPVSGTNNIYVVNRGPIQLSASHPAAQSLSAFSATITNDLTVDTSTLKVDSTNNRVGVGLDTPLATLHVKNATDIDMDNNAAGQLNIQGNGYTGSIALNATGMQIYHNSDVRSIIFGINETERMRIDSSGNVGIGTTSLTSSSGYNTLSINGTTGGQLSFQTGGTGESYIFNDATDFSIYNSNAGSLKFFTNATERMRILSGGGLTFNGDTATANALDDYEEGTWTATAGTGTVTSNNLRYVKIGRQVTLFGYLTSFSDRSSSNGVAISGLPFTSKSDNTAVGATFVRYLNVGGDVVSAYIPSGTSTMSFYASRVNDNYLEVRHSHLSSTLSNMFFTITYQV